MSSFSDEWKRACFINIYNLLLYGYGVLPQTKTLIFFIFALVKI